MSYFIKSDGGKRENRASVSPNDGEPGYLSDKLAAGANVTLTPQNDGGNETLEIAASSGGGGDTFKVSSDDTTADYAENKIVAGSGIVLTTLNPGANEDLEISATGGGSYTPADSTDWDSPNPTSVAGALDELAQENKKLFLVADANSTWLVDGTGSGTGGRTLSLGISDIVYNKDGAMWSGSNPTWLLCPEEGLYLITFHADIDFSPNGSDGGPITVYIEFWDGSTATEVARWFLYTDAVSERWSVTISGMAYRPAGASIMFFEVKFDNQCFDDYEVDWRAGVNKISGEFV